MKNGTIFLISFLFGFYLGFSWAFLPEFLRL